MKCYFENKDSEFAFSKQYFLDKGITEVYEAKVEKCNTYSYCNFNDGCVINKSDCGVKNCTEYNPRNGKNGICKHRGNMYFYTGKLIKLRK